MTTSVSGKVDPVVRRITSADIAEALSQGLRDFQALPLYGLAFGSLYAFGGIIIVLSLTRFGLVYLAYPLAAGFALIGPFVAIGLYEVSRRREAGQPISLAAIWSAVMSRGEIGWMAFVTLFFFVRDNRIDPSAKYIPPAMQDGRLIPAQAIPK